MSYTIVHGLVDVSRSGATGVINTVDVSRFGADVAAGNLPALTVVEPAMHHFPQSDDHASGDKPAVDMYRGQHFLKGVYDGLCANLRSGAKPCS